MSNIGNVGSANSQAVYTANAETKAAKDESQGSGTLPIDTQDTVELGNSTPKATTYKPDTKTVNYLKSIADNNMNTLKKMVDKLLSGQSYTASGSWTKSYSEIFSLNSDDYSVFYQSSSTESFSFSIEVNSADDVQAQASELIGEDGPLGIKAVSNNILDFAKAISGGDPSKIELLKDAVQKGFDQVAALFGGWSKLPDITHDTYDAVMEGFDVWQNGGVETEAGSEE